LSAGALRSGTSAALSLLAPLSLVALAAAIGVAGGTPSFEGTVALGLCNLIIVLGLQVFIGNSGVYSFGQLGFSIAGAYLAAFATIPATFAAFQTPELPPLLAGAQLSPIVATVLAGIGAATLAAVVGVPLMRTSTVAIPISTFAFLIVAYNVVGNWDAVTGGSGGLVSIPRSTDVAVAGVWAAVAVAASLAFKRSASGYRLAATRESELAARSLGIGVLRERMIGFILSAALCGVGAALAVQQSGVLTPNTFYFSATVTTLTMLVFGGVRSILGATVGTFTITALSELLRIFEEGRSVLGLPTIGELPGLGAIGLGVVLLATMIARPEGLTRGREAAELWRALRPGPTPRAPREERQPTRPGRAAAEGALEARGISLSFGGLKVLSGVDLRLGHGEVLGLIGPNGAGKTTLVNVISGFQRADRGSVHLDGELCRAWKPAHLARAGLARSFQAALPFADLSCLENVAVGAMAHGAGRHHAAQQAHSVLERLGLGGTEKTRAGALSGGSQRLLGIGRALATEPRYLILDEPAAGLNEDESAELIDALRGVVADFGCGLLVIEHDMSVVMELCPRIVVLDQGRVVAVGSPGQIQGDPGVIASYLGSSFAVTAGA
jgi:branched-chain amino acid transport system permease protein